MTVYEWQALSIERNSKMVAYWLSTTQEDRLNWKPKAEEGSNTRSVMDLVQECVTVNRKMASTLRGDPAGSEPGGEPPALNGSQHAQDELIASAHDLAEAVRGLDEAAMTRLYTTRVGQLPGAAVMQIPLMNMVYHGGQINYIQRLYGDVEMRFPPDFARPPGQ